MEILKPIIGAAGVFFPIGKPPEGTCGFSNKECLKKCIALTDKPYDEEYRISEAEKRKIREYINTEYLFKKASQIIQ